MLRCLLGSLVQLALAGQTGQAPLVFWASHPVLPNETVAVIGHGLNLTSVRVRAAGTGPRGVAELPTVQSHAAGLAFRLPSAAEPRIFDLLGAGGESLARINAPEVWWTIGDAGAEAATPGGWLRIVGRSLAFARGDCVAPAAPSGPSAAAVRATAELGLPDVGLPPARSKEEKVGVAHGVSVALISAAGGAAVPLLPSEATCWWLDLKVPPTLAAGQYRLQVDNGLGSMIATDHVIELRDRSRWPAAEYRADSSGSIAAALAAAAAGGGGRIVLEPGRYEMPDGETLLLPPNTMLSGSGEATLVWSSNSRVPTVRHGTPKMSDEPGAPLITGLGAFGLESLSIEITSAVGVVVLVPASSNGSWVRRVNITQRFPHVTQYSNGSAIAVNADNVVLESNVIVHGPEHCWRGPTAGNRSWQQVIPPVPSLSTRSRPRPENSALRSTLQVANQGLPGRALSST